MRIRSGTAGMLVKCLAPVALATSALWAPAAHAQTQPNLKYFKNYFLTGDYAAAGVGLRDRGTNGLATDRIRIARPAGLPDDAEVVAAYLYWQTVGPSGGSQPANVAGARFRKNDISRLAIPLNSSGSPTCSSNGGATGSANGSRSLYTYRADVLPFFPRRKPDEPNERVRVDVFDVDHEVTLPDAGGSNQLPLTLGAALVVVYRVVGYDATGAARAPLRSIVLYDGGYTIDQGSRGLDVTLEGFYEASNTAPNARMTHLVGNGQDNFDESIRLQSAAGGAITEVGRNVFTGQGVDSGFDVVNLAAPLAPGAMKARLIVDDGGAKLDCLNYAAVALSTVAQDADSDGLLDVWESRAAFDAKSVALRNGYARWPLDEPRREPALQPATQLPDLQAMGANRYVQDLFVEIDYLAASDHTHLPSKRVLDSVARVFRNAAPRPSVIGVGVGLEPAVANCTSLAAPRGACPINVHFDVGTRLPATAGFNRASCATNWTIDCSIIQPAASVTLQGGDEIPEAPLACTGANCAFQNVPAVSWKLGFRALRDGPANPADRCTADDPGCDARFHRNRKDIFRYALFGHALALENPFQPGKPRRTSGIADAAGADMMITLGLWDGSTGTEFVQGATLLHEIGHTLGLRHGGVLPAGTPGASVLEPNCKPNYQSVMNYLFQVRGMLPVASGDASRLNEPVIDFSARELPSLDEGLLREGAGLGATDYLARWYAPRAASLVDSRLLTSPATRYCDGSRIPFVDGQPVADYVRVDADRKFRNTTTVNAIDWNADGDAADTVDIDVNFDGTFRQALNRGANDFVAMDLRQVGARRNVGSPALSRLVLDGDAVPAVPVGGGLSLDAGLGFGDLGFGDLGFGDLGFGDLGFGDLGFGDLGFGDLGFSDLGFGDLGFGDLGFGDLGFGDLGFGDLGAQPNDDGIFVLGEGDLNLDTAGSLANAPNSLRAQSVRGNIVLNWTPPHVGGVFSYSVQRVIGTQVDATTIGTLTTVAPMLPGTQLTFTDVNVKRSTTYTYFVTAVVQNTDVPPVPAEIRSGPSNFVTIRP